MNVIASPKFEFHFEVPLEALVALGKVSSRHYDQVCREACARDGFIDIWIRTIKNGFTEITATSRMFDTSLKIMEQASLYAGTKVISEKEYALLVRLMNLFSRLFTKSNQLYMASRTEFEENF